MIPLFSVDDGGPTNNAYMFHGAYSQMTKIPIAIENSQEL